MIVEEGSCGYWSEKLEVRKNLVYGYDYDGIGFEVFRFWEGGIGIEFYDVIGYWYGELMSDFEDKEMSKRERLVEEGSRVNCGILKILLRNEFEDVFRGIEV